jgi:putative salt-induced outer membrane protein YdiY
LLVPEDARADAASTMGTPPPDATVVVEAPTAGDAAPKIASPTYETTATVSAGGLLSTGNSQLVAASVNAKFDLRRGADGFGASLVGNYGEGAAAGQALQVTTENLQERLRYDRYLGDRESLFLIGTARHDRFQGLNVRFNVDPGVKYLFVNADSTKLWSEIGYDFQYDIRRDAARGAVGPNGQPMVDSNGNPVPPLLDKTATDHSARLFGGFRHAFNKDVTFSTGVEYLQSLVGLTRYRINYDALVAAGLGGGFSLGVAFSARYDHHPLPGKEHLDTGTTLSLIYSLSEAPPPAPHPLPTCRPPDPSPTPPPATP